MKYFNDIPDHPVIRNMERTGYPDGKAPEYARCPNCGKEAERFSRSISTGVVDGCDNCKEWVEPFEVLLQEYDMDVFEGDYKYASTL